MSIQYLRKALGRVFGEIRFPPLKVTFFAWSAVLGNIFTTDNLRKQ
jgi:hypothetical protein